MADDGRWRWRWLARAATMAAAMTAAYPHAAGRAQPGWPHCPRVATRTPAPDTRAVGVARDFCLATLQRWGLPERADDVAVVVSELLTNALRHGLPPGRSGQQTQPGWPVRLGLVWSGYFVVSAVADPGRSVPRLKEPDYLAESGRGLHVISALSDAWGNTPPTETGKTVWAAFAVGSAPPPPPGRQRLSAVGGAAGPRLR